MSWTHSAVRKSAKSGGRSGVCRRDTKSVDFGRVLLLLLMLGIVFGGRVIRVDMVGRTGIGRVDGEQ